MRSAAGVLAYLGAVGALVFGAYLLHPAAGWIVAGVALLAIGGALTVKKPDVQRRQPPAPVYSSRSIGVH